MFDIGLYNDEFFEWHYRHAREYAVNFMEWYVDKFRPLSVVDFGCGIGSFLEGAHKLGVSPIAGYEIGLDHARKYIPKEILPFISKTDITLPRPTANYECVICIEVAEHIDPEKSEVLVDNLLKSVSESGYILFTAAPESQGGCGHINCHPMSYWEKLFDHYGCDNRTTEQTYIASNMARFGVPKYIIENLRVFQL